MIDCRKNLLILLCICIFIFLHFSLRAQTDSTKKRTLDEYLKTRRGFIGNMIKNLRRDTSEVGKANQLLRNDVPFKEYEGYIIRKINVKDLHFGIPITDTTKKVITAITRFANTIHHATRLQVIRNNLFFRENDTIRPYLMADNETFLRQLPYAQDATIEVKPIDDISDSVDVNVVFKDLFSLGGAIGSLGLKNTDINVREDNVSGSGNAIVVQGLYDMSRNKHFGIGAGYLQRNIGRSFISLAFGYQSYHPSIVGLKEENYYYMRLAKPLINRYKHWTYQLDASYNSTRNMYASDSLYSSDLRYRYYNIDAWAGYNLHATRYSTEKEDTKLRKLISLRFINKEFQDIPGKYFSNYSWRYASLTGSIAAVSFYRQNFYKSQYIYAFGINEDIPEGLNLTLTSGYIKKENLSRPFLGFNYQRSTFNSRKNYFSYTFRAEGYLNHKNVEDINLLAGIDYFDHLKALGTKWKQRTFVNINLAKQINTILNEPLYLDSKLALPAYRNGDIGGSLRTSARVESVFYSPWSLAGFKFAPFLFTDAGLFTPYNTPVNTSSIYTLVGSGVRTRNENLIFGTLELRGYYFLKKNIYNESWRIDFSTNITFRYSQFVGKPDFIIVN